MFLQNVVQEQNSRGHIWYYGRNVREVGDLSKRLRWLVVCFKDIRCVSAVVLGFFLSLMENVTVFHVLLAQWPSANTLYLSGSDESISTQNENKSVQTVGGEDPDLSCLKKSPVPFSGAEERLSQRIVGSVDIFSDAATPVKTNQQDKTRD